MTVGGGHPITGLNFNNSASTLARSSRGQAPASEPG